LNPKEAARYCTQVSAQAAVGENIALKKSQEFTASSSDDSKNYFNRWKCL
jgi:hypothetical protein